MSVATKPAPTSLFTGRTPAYDAVPPLALIRAHADRLFKITVCTRPFRVAGPRIEAERIPAVGTDKLVIHNYGHGGSGWSLSWGSAQAAIELASTAGGQSPSGQDVAVIGMGALGLTLATTLQQAGARVTLYTKDRPADTRSFRATGSWTPDSRVALTRFATPTFAAQWEQMARISWRTYGSYLSLPGAPVEFTDRYFLSDLAPEQAYQAYLASDPIGFARLSSSIADFSPHSIDLPPGTHPFPTRYARRNSQLMFNITELVHLLTEDFLRAGGRIETREFHTPADLALLPQSTIFNCTGHASRALFNDQSLIPVRGQIAWLAPQPECNYGLVHNDLSILCRRDGIVVQLSQQGEATGWQDPTEQPDHTEAEQGIRQLQSLMNSPRKERIS